MKRIALILLTLTMILSTVIVPVAAEPESATMPTTAENVDTVIAYWNTEWSTKIGYQGYDSALDAATVAAYPELTAAALENPSNTSFKISSKESLLVLQTAVNGGNRVSGRSFYLTADIDLSGLNWAPIGYIANNRIVATFEGLFDGRGYSVKNLTCDSNTLGITGIQTLGLFGHSTRYKDSSNAHVGGIIRNLVVENPKVTGTNMADEVGFKDCKYGSAAILGNSDMANVTNCKITGNSSSFIFADVAVGGAVGETGGDVSYITNEVTIIGDNGWASLGGVVGVGGWITNCINTATVYYQSRIGCYQIGGISGGGSNRLTNCINTGDLTIYLGEIGGITTSCLADNASYLCNLANYGVVKQTGSQGNGHCGSIAGTHNKAITITNLYNFGYAESAPFAMSEGVLPIRGLIPVLSGGAAIDMSTCVDVTLDWKYGGDVPSSPLNGLKGLFIGDSITEGALDDSPIYQRSWAGRFTTEAGVYSTNAGIGGATFAVYPNKAWIHTEFEANSDRTFDFIMLEGVNDARNSIAVGSVQNTTDEALLSSDAVLATYAGGLQWTMYNLRKQNPDAEMFFIASFHSVDTQGNYPRVDQMYFPVARQLCELYDAHYIDLYNNEELTHELNPSSSTYVPDILHPNAAGYDIIFPYIYNDVVEVMINNGSTTTPPTDPADPPVDVPAVDPTIEIIDQWEAKFGAQIGYQGFDRTGWENIATSYLEATPENIENPGAYDADEFVVTDPETLVAISDYVRAGNTLEGITLYLANDIDMSGIANFMPIGYRSVQGESTILDEKVFKGSFNGLGYKISNLNINAAALADKVGNLATCGLFGYASGATIQNLVMENATILNEAYRGATNGNGAVNGTGTIIGNGNATIRNCKVTGSRAFVAGYGCVGGFAGQNGSDMQNLTNDAKVEGLNTWSNVGGISGTNGWISRCVNTGAISYRYSLSQGYIGGINGFWPSQLALCINFGDVTCGGDREYGMYGSVGGIGGYGARPGPYDGYCQKLVNYGTVSQYNSVASDRCGTILGVYENQDVGIMTDCHNFGIAYNKGSTVCGMVGQFKNTNVTLDKTTSQDHSLAELLKVRYQQTVVANEDGTYNVRFVIAIDDRSAYEQVIFTFTNEENQTSEVIVDKVCTSLYGAGIEYTPSGVTGTENAQYFCTFNLINIPVDTVLKVSAAVLTTEETPATWSGATQTISISAPNA